jgi:hypothetical protein
MEAYHLTEQFPSKPYFSQAFSACHQQGLEVLRHGSSSTEGLPMRAWSNSALERFNCQGAV